MVSKLANIFTEGTEYLNRGSYFTAFCDCMSSKLADVLGLRLQSDICGFLVEWCHVFTSMDLFVLLCGVLVIFLPSPITIQGCNIKCLSSGLRAGLWVQFLTLFDKK